MAVNGVNPYNNQNYVSNTQQNSESAAAAEETAAAAEETSKATNTKQQTETYKPDMDKIREMKADLSNNMKAFKQMVYSQIRSQGDNSNNTLKELLGGISGMSKEEAAAAVADDGEWGVDATATRILDFAKALSGGDPSKIEELRDAVNKGFAAAGKVWGGDLPEISQKTLQKVMEGFDEWAKSGNAASDPTQVSNQAQASGALS